jgi:uncharacterized membrane protein YkvA (DUF1232 family)
MVPERPATEPLDQVATVPNLRSALPAPPRRLTRSGDDDAVPRELSSDWPVPVSIGAGLVLLWLFLLLALWVVRPDEDRLRETLRLLPDVICLLRRLAADSTLPGGRRVRLVLLLAYLAVPVDLVPDFVPVLGYADDAIIVAVVLRSMVRAAGPQSLEQLWPGSPEGLAAMRRMARI